jgi:hypothetical protein
MPDEANTTNESSEPVSAPPPTDGALAVAVADEPKEVVASAVTAAASEAEQNDVTSPADIPEVAAVPSAAEAPDAASEQPAVADSAVKGVDAAPEQTVAESEQAVHTSAKTTPPSVQKPPTEAPQETASPAEPNAPNGRNGAFATAGNNPEKPAFTLETASEPAAQPNSQIVRESAPQMPQETSSAEISPETSVSRPAEQIMQSLPSVAVPSTAGILSRLREKWLELKGVRTQKRLAKILALASARGCVTNDDVEKLLHVAHNTATRYLVKLVAAGSLRREGAKGAGVKYYPI